MNIANLLMHSGAVFADKPAVAFGNDVVLNYQQLAKRSAIIADKLLIKYQLSPGDRVAIISANCPQYIELLFAVWHAGLVAVPVNAKLHENELHYVLEHSGAVVCFTSTTIAADIIDKISLIASFKILIEINSKEYLGLVQGKTAPIFNCQPNHPAWLFYTSGTTGKPKGALLSHKNLLAMTQCYFSDIDEISPGDSIFHAAPLSHGSGFYVLPHVAHGAINVIPASGRFDEQELLTLLLHYKNVSLFAAPTMLKRWLKHYQKEYQKEYQKNSIDKQNALQNIKTIIYGGGPMYQQDLVNAQQLLGNKLVQMYGQGESPMTICALTKYHHSDKNHPDYKLRLASVGTAMLGIRLKIVDNNGREVKNGQAGEIFVHGDTVMLGYLSDPQASQETLINGWLKTGDMGIKSSDGFITLVDRSKDVIISGGSNIYPREVEEILNRHPEVVEISVFGKKDDNWGEVVVAAVVLIENSSINSSHLDQYCLTHMTRFKRPKKYFFLKQLPKNNTGKILKTMLREQYTGI